MAKRLPDDYREQLEEYEYPMPEEAMLMDYSPKGENIVILAPDVAQVFTTSDEVNEALRFLIRMMKQSKQTSS